jgi:hypothetical protein
MSKESQNLKTLYADERHHRIARAVSAILGVSMREATERLLRGDQEAVDAARKISSHLDETMP